jgi:hypothetical protein
MPLSLRHVNLPISTDIRQVVFTTTTHNLSDWRIGWLSILHSGRVRRLWFNLSCLRSWTLQGLDLTLWCFTCCLGQFTPLRSHFCRLRGRTGKLSGGVLVTCYRLLWKRCLTSWDRLRVRQLADHRAVDCYFLTSFSMGSRWHDY